MILIYYQVTRKPAKKVKKCVISRFMLTVKFIQEVVSMANKAGFTGNAVGNMIRHYTREPDPETGVYPEYPRKEGGGRIDSEKTAGNYSIGPCHGVEWVRERLKNVYQRPQDRGKAPVMLDIVVTMPKDEPLENEKKFFQAAHESLCRQFGRKDNVVGCWVHLDEAQPHCHFAFLPVSDKRMKSRPEVREGISQVAYFPKKSSLREMHETLQRDISKQLGHRVAILNGATLEGNKTISELKAESRQYMELVQGNRGKLEELAEGVKETRTAPIVGRKVYQMEPETLNKVFVMAAAGATAGATEQERLKVVQNAIAKEKQADKERAAALKELECVRSELIETRIAAEPFLQIPKPLRKTAAAKIEGWRNKYRDNTDRMNRDICKMFLDNGRDYAKTLQQARPLLNAMGIEKEVQGIYIKGCLSAVKKQAMAIKAVRQKGSAGHGGKYSFPAYGGGGGGGYVPPERGKGWKPKPKETNFFPDITDPGVPVINIPPGSMDWMDWILLDDEEKQEIIERLNTQ